MTRRVCLIGNSHLAALRDALTRNPDAWPDVAFTCVGGHGETLLETQCVDGVLRPQTQDAREAFEQFGGVSEVVLDGFDAVVVAGCQVACARAGALYRRARWYGLPSMATCRDWGGGPWALVSEPGFAATLRDMLQETLGLRLLARLRAGSNARLFLASQPRLTSQVRTQSDHPLSINNHIIAAGDGAAVSAIFESTVTKLVSELGATFLSQPSQTITDDLLTADPFTVGAVRLTRAGRSPQPREDLLHANATYGRLVLDQIAAQLTPA